ncbi:hypothetical protein BDAP_001898 [Binucleata daphniae]
MSEIKKKRIPGISDNIKAISICNEEIKQIQDNIQMYKNKIQKEQSLQKDKLGRSHLFDTKNAINDEIKALYDQKENERNRKEELFAKIQEMRATLKTQKNVLSLSDIEKKEREITEKMMSEKYTSQQEKEYQAQLLELKKKKSFVGDNKENEKKMHDLERELQKVKESLEKTNTELFGRKKEMEELRIEIDSMKEKEKTKSDATIMYENKIEELKLKRDEVQERKRKEHDEIRRKEEEHEKHMAEMAVQMEIESKKKDQKMKIRKLNETVIALEEEKSGCDPNKFDAVISYLKNMKGTNNIPIGVVLKLNGEGIAIPTKQEDIQKAIETLEKKKSNFGAEIEGKLGNINEKIKKLVDEIENEKKKLEAMPVTETRYEKVHY